MSQASSLDLPRMVGVTKIQRGNAGYWLAAVAEGGEDYYSKPGEAPGGWVGGLAAQLGLSGEVDPEGYAAILEGHDPTSGAQLVKRPATRFRLRPDGSQKRVEPVLGYDVRFSAPKSVSILYALGDEPTRARVLAILDEAVAAGLAHLEAEACFVQRGAGGKMIERGSGLVGMAFRHRMSRAGDPALHVHVLVSNLTRSAGDGKWLSLASPKGRSPLWPHGKSAGVVFQAALRAGFLREFGLEFDAVHNGYADLSGFSREAIDALSTRSREIAAWMGKYGVSSAKAAQVAAYRTRDAKDYRVSVDERTAEWIAQAEPHGLTPAGLREMVGVARPREPRTIDPLDVDAAVSALEAKTSHFDRRALLWAIADQLPEGADLRSLNAAVDLALSSDRVICIYTGGGLDPARYTTPRIAELERSFIEGAIAGVGAGVGLVPIGTVEHVLARHPWLGSDQRAMVVRLTTGGEAVVPVAARPGTGKTTALAAAREVWEGGGVEVIGVATARTASGELADAGVPSTSIAALLSRAEAWRERGRGLPRGIVILVDEASMTCTQDLEALRVLAMECGGKLAVIGDTRQIGAIGPGGSFTHLVANVEPAELTTIRRQRHEADRELIDLVHEGRGSEALDLLRTQGKLIVGEDLSTTLDGLLADWYRDFATGADVVMIARRNREVESLNAAARALRISEGALGPDELLIGELGFAVGDRVLTRVNGRGVDNRERWEVMRVDGAARTIRLRRLGGDEREVQLGPRYLKREARDGGPVLQHAYAITHFGAQGKTFDRAYPLLDAAANIEEQMVALSRGREVANVYVVANTGLLDPEHGALWPENADSLHEVRQGIEREGADFAAAEFALRREVDSLSTFELAERRIKLEALAKAGEPGVRLRGQVERIEQWVERLAKEREALEAMASPPRGELARVRSEEATQAGRVQALRSEIEGLPEPTRGEAGGISNEASRRLEMVLIEGRINRLARAQVAAGRLGESDVLYATLGPFPGGEGEEALAWGRGAHAIAAYRVRHAVSDELSPFGSAPRDSAARAEREAAIREVSISLQSLGRSRAIAKQLDRGLTLDR